MAKLLQCTTLTELKIEHNFDLPPGCLLPFNHNTFPFLHRIKANGCGLWTEDLEAIAKGCPNLESLVIYGNPKIRNAGVVALCHSESKLEIINLQQLHKLSDPALIALAECPSLHHAYLGRMKATENGLSAFARGRSSTSLRRLVSPKIYLFSLQPFSRI